MNNEIRFTNKIRQALNEGARLDARIAERLRAARERALDVRRVSPVSAHAPALARAGIASAGFDFGGIGGFSLRVLVPMALLVAGLISIYTWQQEQRASDVVELDAQLLTDDLPIDAYLDRGFEAWLKKRSASSEEGSN